MNGDLSRNTFDRTLHYSAVRLQQGRIVTDADWNEQADLTRYRAERQARDVIGACGAPSDAPGYALVPGTYSLAVQAINANVAWIAGEDGVLLQTTSAGADWHLVDVGTTAHLRALRIVGNVGWVVGDGGVVRKTLNQGLSWSALDAGTWRSLRGLSVFDADHAWAVGDGGIVLRTSDGGAHWALAQTEAARLHAVHFADALAGVAVGQDGVILSSADGGATWVRRDSGTGAHLRALAFISSTHGWAAGDDGTVLRTEDGGATWQAGSTPGGQRLRAIAFRDAGEGWASGDAGVVLHSADGGAKWVQQDYATEATLRALAIFGGEPGWAVGDASVALRVDSAPQSPAEVPLPAVSLSLLPGRCYVQGTLCELESRASYYHQPDGALADRLVPGTYLLYLDAWQRHISCIEAPLIREVALGGPDTATRSRTLCQVRALPLLALSPPDWNCDADIPEWTDLIEAPMPRLAARAEPQLAAASLCEIAVSAGYRRLENQLYRVEVHEGGAAPTFKWSRENGTVAYAVVSLTTDAANNRTVVRLAARGRDANLDLAVHDRVELIDDDAASIQRVGMLLEYLADGDDELEVVLAGVPGGALGRDASSHPLLRRWDHKPADAGSHALPLIEGSWIELEDGVQVRFEPGGSYRPGDFWQIPARTITGDVEWPRDEDGQPVSQAPAGIEDRYGRLGLVEVDVFGAMTVVADCRELFPPLTSLEQLLYVSGDGQDGLPDAMLPQALAVRVSRGTLPMPGIGVRFTVESGDGTVGPDAGAGPGAGAGASWLFEATTDAQGEATCRWTLGPRAAASARFQRVRTSLLNANGQAIHGQDIVFGATASLALQYVSGDGQQVGAGSQLDHPLEVRVANAQQGLSGATVRFTVTEGLGALIGANPVTTDVDGLASVAWQLGADGAQRVSAELLDSDGQALQRLSFNANIATNAAAFGGCDVTIGESGQIAKLDTAELRRLLERFGGNVCLCFLPGEHVVEDLAVGGGGRLAIHGCGQTSHLRIRGRVQLSAFDALEIRDLAIELMGESGLDFEKNAEVRLSNLHIGAPRRADRACLRIAGAARVCLTETIINTTMPGVAAVFEDIGGDCHVAQSRFNGIVSFYGEPREVPSRDKLRSLLDRLNETRELRLESNTARLFFGDNSVSLLTIGARKFEQLASLAVDGLFETAVFQGNTLVEPLNLFVSRLLAFGGNALMARPDDGTTPYGVLVADRATAVGNVATVFGDQTILHFVAKQGFAKAANQVFIQP